MYTIDRHDRVVEVTEVPRPSVGAPLPVALADEGRVLLAYLLDVPVPGWDGTWTRVVDLDTADPVVLVRFTGVVAWQWGPPNDEAFQGPRWPTEVCVPTGCSASRAPRGSVSWSG
jgi:hypothetical protein